MVDAGHAADRGAVVDGDGLALDAPKVGKCGLRRGLLSGELEPLAHHSVEDQRHEAEAGVRLDAFGQPVEDRRDLADDLRTMLRSGLALRRPITPRARTNDVSVIPALPFTLPD